MRPGARSSRLRKLPGSTSSSTVLPFVALPRTGRGTQDRGFRTAVAGTDSDGADAPSELERNATVLYCTFSRRREPYQVLGPKYLLDPKYCCCKSFRLVANEEPASRRRCELFQEVDVRHLFADRNDLLRVLLSGLAQAKCVNGDGDAFHLLGDVRARQLRGVVDAVAEQNDRA